MLQDSCLPVFLLAWGMNVECCCSLCIQPEFSTLHLGFHFHFCSLCGNERNVFNPLYQDKTFSLKRFHAKHQAPMKPLPITMVQRALDESFLTPYPVKYTRDQSQPLRVSFTLKNSTHFPGLIPHPLPPTNVTP